MRRILHGFIRLRYQPQRAICQPAVASAASSVSRMPLTGSSGRSKGFPTVESSRTAQSAPAPEFSPRCAAFLGYEKRVLLLQRNARMRRRFGTNESCRQGRNLSRCAFRFRRQPYGRLFTGRNKLFKDDYRRSGIIVARTAPVLSSVLRPQTCVSGL